MLGAALLIPRTSLYSKVPKIGKMLGMDCYQVDFNSFPYGQIPKILMNFLKKLSEMRRKMVIVIVNIPTIPEYINRLANWMDVLEDKGITLITIADLKKINID